MAHKGNEANSSLSYEMRPQSIEASNFTTKSRD